MMTETAIIFYFALGAHIFSRRTGPHPRALSLAHSRSLGLKAASACAVAARRSAKREGGRSALVAMTARLVNDCLEDRQCIAGGAGPTVSRERRWRRRQDVCAGLLVEQRAAERSCGRPDVARGHVER